MDNKNILFEYTKDQLESNRSELSRLRGDLKLVEAQIESKEVIVKKLEDDLRSYSSSGESFSIETGATSLNKEDEAIIDILNECAGENGLTIKEVWQESYRRHGEGSLAKRTIESYVNGLIARGKLEQATPEAQRNRRFRIRNSL